MEGAFMTMVNGFYQKDYRNRDFPINAVLTTAHCSFQWHWHEEVEIIVCVKSSHIVGLQGRFYELNPGDIIIIPSNLLHNNIVTSDHAQLTIKFSPQLLGNCSEELAAFFARNLISLFWSEEDKNAMYQFIWTLWEEYNRKSFGYQAAVSAQLYSLLTYAVRHLPLRETQTDTQDSTERISNTIQEVLMYISKNFREPLTLSDCAAEFNFNTHYFSTLFSKTTGITFHKYLSILRLREFEHLLLTTDRSITELCSASGFTSVKSLNRTFADTWHMSPSKYRRKFQQEKEAK